MGLRVDVFISQEVEQADIETQESVIRVVSPTDVQFKLDDQDKEEVSPHSFSRMMMTRMIMMIIAQVVVNLTSPEALCLDTAAFVGVPIISHILFSILIISNPISFNSVLGHHQLPHAPCYCVHHHHLPVAQVFLL